MTKQFLQEITDPLLEEPKFFVDIDLDGVELPDNIEEANKILKQKFIEAVNKKVTNNAN